MEVQDNNVSDLTRQGSKFCGHELPAPISSTGNSITLVFHSDESANEKGFTLKAYRIGKIYRVQDYTNANHWDRITRNT